MNSYLRYMWLRIHIYVMTVPLNLINTANILGPVLYLAFCQSLVKSFYWDGAGTILACRQYSLQYWHYSYSSAAAGRPARPSLSQAGGGGGCVRGSSCWCTVTRVTLGCVCAEIVFEVTYHLVTYTTSPLNVESHSRNSSCVWCDKIWEGRQNSKLLILWKEAKYV